MRHQGNATGAVPDPKIDTLDVVAVFGLLPVVAVAFVQEPGEPFESGAVCTAIETAEGVPLVV